MMVLCDSCLLKFLHLLFQDNPEPWEGRGEMNNLSVSVTPNGGGQCVDYAKQASTELVSFSLVGSVALLDAVLRGEAPFQG